MHRSVLVFSIRTAGEPSAVESLRVRVEEALDCTFKTGSFHSIPALVTDLLGMQVGLFGWRGLRDHGVIRLEGQPGESRMLEHSGDTSLEIQFTDISQAIADLLEVRGAGHWYLPDAAHRGAEEAYAMDVDRAFMPTSECPELASGDDDVTPN